MIDLSGLYPKVKYLAEKLITECKKQGYNIIITSAYRSIEEQNEIYAQGRTKAGQKITNAKGGQSMHNYRMAFDVCINSKADAYNESLLTRVGQIGKKLGLEWGGDFKSFVDMPHFQYTKGLTLSEIQAGKRPSDINEIPKEEPKMVQYKDSNKIHDWAKDAVKYVTDNKIMMGDSVGNFNPRAPITREEMAVVIQHLMTKK